jgi:hypothetical protein
MILVCGLVTVACKKKNETNNPIPDTDESGLGEDGADTNSAENDAQLLTSSLLTQSGSGSIGLASTEDLGGGDGIGTRGIGDGVRAIFIPRGCVTPTSNEAEHTVTYAFNKCTGPYALLNITGEVKVTYRLDGNTLHLDLAATDLEVNQATVDWAATADITADGLKRDMKWHATLSGKTRRGRDFNRTNDVRLQWTVGEPCFALQGTSTGNVRTRNLKTEIENFRRCRGSCPEAGGVIRVTNLANNATVTISFDGSNRATILTPKKETLSLPLFCNPN